MRNFGFQRLDEDFAHGDFLQVLIHDLELKRRGSQGGIELTIRIKGQEEILTSTAQKAELRCQLDLAEGRQLEAAFKAFRQAEDGASTTLQGENFAFRHASAGILPILKVADEDLAILFERDIHPCGWNIANGASSDRRELGAIETLLEREAAEELLFWDKKRQCLEFLACENPSAELKRALKLWQKELGANTIESRPWLRSGDWPGAQTEDTLRVIDAGGTENSAYPPSEAITNKLSISLQAEDFGIECLRVCEVGCLSAGLPLDGEISGGNLLNRNIGLMPLKAWPQGHPQRAYRHGVALNQLPATTELCPVAANLRFN